MHPLKELPENPKCFPKENSWKESVGSGSVILELTGRLRDPGSWFVPFYD